MLIPQIPRHLPKPTLILPNYDMLSAENDTETLNVLDKNGLVIKSEYHKLTLKSTLLTIGCTKTYSPLGGGEGRENYVGWG